MLNTYDHYKLDNGETRARFDYEPDKEIETPLTCQACGAEYEYSEKGATGGFCPWCNGVERRAVTASTRLIFALNMIAGIAVGAMLATAIIFNDSDLLWNNTTSFWSQIL